ncbi:MAG: 6-bladed beta-propeller [Alphaproteobacteria bacterium]
MRAMVVLLCLFVLSACAAREKVAPVLQPVAGAQVWPLPPDRPRYAYAGTLTGETDFLPTTSEGKSTGTKVLELIIGFVFGEPHYTQLVRPVAGLVDREGRVLVTDMGRPGILVFDMTKNGIDLWQVAAEGQTFVSPVGIAEDGSGGFYVTDSQLGDVFHLDRDGQPLKGFGKVELVRPTGIARDRATGNFYVADTGKHQVMVFSKEGELQEILGSRGTELGQFNFPTHLAVQGDSLYVSDSLNFRVQVLNLRGEHKLSIGQLGANIGDMSRPKGVAAGVDGRIYVVESFFDHILIFDSKGRFLMPIDGGTLQNGTMYLPSGVWTDRENRVYVADMFNGRVCVFKELTGGADQ